MHSTRAFLSSAVGILLLVGLTALPGLLVSPPASAQDVLHEVQAGDDLRLIAGYYYGDTRLWERIWRANRDVVRNPNRIERGSYLWIPDAKMPAESYAAYLAQARQPAPAAPTPAAAGIQIPKLEGEAGPPGALTPGAPAAAAPQSQPAKAPPVSAPRPAKATMAPAKAAEPAKAMPAPAGPPPAKAAPSPGPQKPAESAKAVAPPAKADVAKVPPPAAPPASLQAKAATPGPPAPPPPAAQPAKAPAPPAKQPLPPPPPPKEWYEELLSPEFFTSVEFLAGVGVLLLGLVGLLFWRRRSAAMSEE